MKFSIGDLVKVIGCDWAKEENKTSYEYYIQQDLIGSYRKIVKIRFDYDDEEKYPYVLDLDIDFQAPNAWAEDELELVYEI